MTPARSRRKAIRKALKALLKGKTLAGNNVFTNRSAAAMAHELPLIIVYSRGEDFELASTAPREYRRRLQLAIEIIAQGSEDGFDEEDELQDILDDIADQVETELSRSETVGVLTEAVNFKANALVDELLLVATEFEYRGEGKKPEGSIILICNVVYHEARPRSEDEAQSNEAAIAPLKTIIAEWQVGHHDSPPDGIVEATDQLDGLDNPAP